MFVTVPELPARVAVEDLGTGGTEPCEGTLTLRKVEPRRPGRRCNLDCQCGCLLSLRADIAMRLPTKKLQV
jgi:hypothetical protein